eukprot:TRINITY_DN82588_c0_g1_i1.p1 TRINITY_DN82588_c0_g1~~TRINITY_DN82588_c0_g1_i1.p1  ORF type:complete len:429 (-),score=72.18 TRINITY_DN82588_c0_g1_i1:103-1206(-)
MSRAYDEIPTEATGFVRSRGAHSTFSGMSSLGQSGLHQSQSVPALSTSTTKTDNGTHFKHGVYGDKLQDPCLLSPKRSQEPIVRGPDSGDMRPLAAQELQVGRHKPRNDIAAPSTVRANTAFEQRARLHHNTLHKRREEAVIEHARFESGVFDGCWRDPLLDSKGALPEPGPAEDHEWMGTAALDYMVGREDELCLSEGRHAALRLVVGLDMALRQAKSRLSDIFNAENSGPKCQFEPTEFLQGLVRLKVLSTAGFDEETLCQAMSVIDPSFDGHISLPVLSRALKAVRACISPSRRVSSKMSFTTCSGEKDHGEEICPTTKVPKIRVEWQEDSISSFQKSFTKFKSQQKQLLDQHLPRDERLNPLG